MRHYNDMSFLPVTEQPNVDRATGIRYAWISSHRLSQEAVQDIENNGDNLTYRAAVDEFKRELRGLVELVRDGQLDTARDRFDDEYREYLWSRHHTFDVVGELVDMHAQGAEPDELVDEVFNFVQERWGDGVGYEGNAYRYESDGIIVELAGDGDLVVMKSPVVLTRGLGSPCIPNGCHLETPGEYLCYALPMDWFDGDWAGADAQEPPYRAEDLRPAPGAGVAS